MCIYERKDPPWYLSISPCPTRNPMLSSLETHRPFSCTAVTLHYINSTCHILTICFTCVLVTLYGILLFCDSVFSNVISPALTESPDSALLTYWIISLCRNWKRASSAISSQTETDKRPKPTTGINQLLL